MKEERKELFAFLEPLFASTIGAVGFWTLLVCQFKYEIYKIHPAITFQLAVGFTFISLVIVVRDYERSHKKNHPVDRKDRPHK